MNQTATDQRPAESAITNRQRRREIHQFVDNSWAIGELVMLRRCDRGNSGRHRSLRVIAANNAEGKLGRGHRARPRSKEQRKQRYQIHAPIVNRCGGQQEHSSSSSE